MKESVLVTGASGFVGKYLCHELEKYGHTVRPVYRRNITIEHLRTGALVEDVDSKTNWSEALKGIDVVIHLAARVHVMHDDAVGSLDEFLKVNLHGTANLAKQAAASGVKRFVYVSSVKVNGEFTGARPFSGSDQPGPQDAYGISKWQAEQALHNISRETGMEVVIIRPPLVYGPGVKANFAKLLGTVNRGVPLPFTRIENSRSLIYVENLVDALIACATHPAAAGQTYLVSDGENVSTPQLIRLLAEALHRPNRTFPVPLTLMHAAARLIGKSAAIDRLTQSLEVDSSKIRNELSWKPPYTMTQGLQVTADWYCQLAKSSQA